MNAWNGWQVTLLGLTTTQSWYDTYRDDLTSPQAQRELRDLWDRMWTDMMGHQQQYAPGEDWTAPSDTMWADWMGGSMTPGATWDPAHLWGTGYGSAWMTAHPAGMVSPAAA